METLGIIILAILLVWLYLKLRSRRRPDSVKCGSPTTAKVPLGRILPPDLAQLEVEDYYTIRVAGVSYPNDDGSSRQAILARCKVPEVLDLRRQPGHRHDKNAVRVLRQNGEMLGFIPRDEARIMAPELDNGRRYVAVLTALDGGSSQKRFRGASLLIVKIKEEAGE